MKEYNVVGVVQQNELTKSRQLSSLNVTDMFQAIRRPGNTAVLLPPATAHHFYWNPYIQSRPTCFIISSNLNFLNVIKSSFTAGPLITTIIIIIIIMPKPVCEKGDVTVLWNQAVHTDREVTAHRPDIINKN